MSSICAALAALGFALFASSPAFAETANKIDAADTAFMIASTALILMMTLPGLALFYSGMVRKKNVLATMAQSLIATAIVSLLLEGGLHQFLVQAQGVGVTVLWCAFGAFVVLKLTNLLAPLRVGSDQEREGLDIALHGEALHQ